MARGKHVAYYRVSTRKQGESGLGLEAQKAAVSAFLDGGKWIMVAEFIEVESGKRNDRPQLAAALQACKLFGAKLVVAKLDRLSRNAAFLMTLRDSGVDFVCADMPEANRLTIGILALVAENEADAISTRTKAALAAARARGVRLGGNRGRSITRKEAALGAAAMAAKARERAKLVWPIVDEMRARGASLRDIAAELERRGIETAAGRTTWTAAGVQRVIARGCAA
jgi:DNA invertase Pin-like site-specific DNA recombinase